MLNPRQEAFYLDLIDLYEPDEAQAADGELTDPTFPTNPTFVNVQCQYIPTPDFESIAGLGQMTEDNIMTQDRFHTDVTQKVNSDWKVVMKTPGHVLYGRSWTVQGNPMPVMARGRRQANFLEIYAKLGTA